MDVRQHKIQFKTTTGGGEDANGDPIPVVSGWTEPVSCHYNTEGKDLIYQLPDGSVGRYSYMVILDPTPTNYFGVFVSLIDQFGNIREEEIQVQKCVNRQLSTKLYL